MNLDAAAPAAEQSGGVEEPILQYLTFQLSKEVYAVNILHVREIIQFSAMTPIPMMPEFILGVINLRGSVVPVLDLSSRFGDKKIESTKRTSIIIIEIQLNELEFEVGIMVDIVNDVLELRQSDIESPPSFGSKIRTDFIEGMGKVGERFLILLNIENILSIEELSAVEKLTDLSPNEASLN